MQKAIFRPAFKLAIKAIIFLVFFLPLSVLLPLFITSPVYLGFALGSENPSNAVYFATILIFGLSTIILFYAWKRIIARTVRQLNLSTQAFPAALFLKYSTLSFLTLSLLLYPLVAFPSVLLIASVLEEYFLNNRPLTSLTSIFFYIVFPALFHLFTWKSLTQENASLKKQKWPPIIITVSGLIVFLLVALALLFYSQFS